MISIDGGHTNLDPKVLYSVLQNSRKTKMISGNLNSCTVGGIVAVDHVQQHVFWQKFHIKAACEWAQHQ